MSQGYDDIILPEGFDPNLGDANFTAEGEIADIATSPTIDANAVPESDLPASAQLSEVDESNTSLDTPAETPQQKVKVKYNHEERELSLDEAAVYAQKGMNYDRIEQRSREQERKLQRYEEQAKMFGFENAEDMMTKAENNFVEVKVRDLVNQGNPEALARFLVAQEMKTLKPEEPKSVIPPERKAEIDEFNAAYPEVTKIPDEVFAMHVSGTRLKTAYEIWEKQEALKKSEAERKAAQDELAILRQNQAAAARAPVTGTVGNLVPGTPASNDPFIMGFDSDY